MAVDIIKCRTQIQDQPKTYPAPQSGNMSPEVLGTADGNTTVFYTQRQNIVAGSLQVFTWTMPTTGGAPTYSLSAGSTYNISGDGKITFGTAPTSGKFVGAVYQATFFSDAEIQTYLDMATAQFTSDATVLAAFQFFIIPAIASNRDKCVLYRFGSYTEDPNVFTSNLLKLRDQLRKDLTGDPIPGKAVPSLTIGSVGFTEYQPQH